MLSRGSKKTTPNDAFIHKSVNYLFFVYRIIKEKTTYEKEVEQNENRIEKMKRDGKDEYDIKKMVIH